jgi:hypothetical protein
VDAGTSRRWLEPSPVPPARWPRDGRQRSQDRLRAPADTYERVERVRAAVQRKTLGAHVSTSEVFRLALLRGLKVVERRFHR